MLPFGLYEVFYNLLRGTLKLLASSPAKLCLAYKNLIKLSVHRVFRDALNSNYINPNFAIDFITLVLIIEVISF